MSGINILALSVLEYVASVFYSIPNLKNHGLCVADHT